MVTFDSWLDELERVMEPALLEFKDEFCDRILDLQQDETLLVQGGTRSSGNAPTMRLELDEFCLAADKLKPSVIGAEVAVVGWMTENVTSHIEEKHGVVPALMLADRLAPYKNSIYYVDAMFVHDGMTFVTAGEAEFEIDVEELDAILEAPDN